MRWIHSPVPGREVEALALELRVSPVLAELLVRAGLGGRPADARRFLEARLGALEDPMRVTHIGAAARRLRDALAANERITVLGDYDVDGVSSTALLVAVLRHLGATPSFSVPRRLEEGYGLSRGAIDRALADGPRPGLFIALDCGTNSVAEVAHLRSLGVDVIILDHHRSKEAVPADCLLVNPHIHDAPGGAWTHLCTVGLVFKLVHALLKILRGEGNAAAAGINLKDFLDFVALGTIADLVPLTGENRILARHGLQVLRSTQHAGLAALMDVAGIPPSQPLQPVDVSFRIGPRINASGRLADAGLSVELLLSRDPAFCLEASRQLDGFNRERQEIERAITTVAEETVDREMTGAAGLVLYDRDWHPGVVGIVANRICRKYNRPAIVLGTEGGLARGSGRGVPGSNLVEILASCQDILESWGGHPMAVGVSLRPERVPEFRERFDAAVRAAGIDGVDGQELGISAWIPLEQVHDTLADELELLHPFGQGNPEPTFGVRGAVLHNRPDVFREQHFRFNLEDGVGRRIYGVAWKLAHRIPPLDTPVDLAIQVGWNHYNGRQQLQIELLDWRLHEAHEK